MSEIEPPAVLKSILFAMAVIATALAGITYWFEIHSYLGVGGLMAIAIIFVTAACLC